MIHIICFDLPEITAAYILQHIETNCGNEIYGI